MKPVTSRVKHDSNISKGYLPSEVKDCHYLIIGLREAISEKERENETLQSTLHYVERGAEQKYKDEIKQLIDSNHMFQAMNSEL